MNVISIETLKTVATFKIKLSDGETLTVACFSPNGINFIIGTSFGHIHIGTMKLDSSNKMQIKFARIDKIISTTEFSVTSVQISNFEPVGSLLVAFSNGVVRTW